MAAVIPEAAGAVTEGSAAVEGAGASARARAAAGGAAAGGGGQRRRREAPRGGQQRERQFKQAGKKAGRGALKARLPGAHTYQPVILAEFVVAIVIVSVSPVAKGGTAESIAKGSPSPYSVNTLKQLVAIGMAYFVLALLAASQRMGRYAAWFGGLILLGLGFTQLANGDLTALFKVFGPGASSVSPAATGTTGTPGQPPEQATLNPTAIFPTVEPGGTVTPAITQSGTATTITAPAGGNAVVTSGPGPGVNLA